MREARTMIKPASDPAGPTGRLCTWLASTTLEDVPLATQERAKYLLLDGFSCLLLGAHLPWSKIAVEAILAVEPKGDSLIAGWDTGVSPASAVMLNSAFIQGFELDDYYPAAPLHSTALVLPALLAATQVRGGISGKQFLLAAILGFETGTRVGRALHGGQMLARGWHSGAVFGGPAAAAAAGKLYDLSAGGFEDALGTAATQAGGLMAAQFGSMAKRMQHGFSARNGFYAAVLAAGGYTGIEQVFEREYGGFLSCFGAGHAPDASQIALDLGSEWNTHAIAIKPYAAMGGVHAAIDAVIDMQRTTALDPATIASIEIEMGEAAYHHGGFAIHRPIVPVTAQMSVMYSVAVTLLDGNAMIEQYTPDRIDSDDVWNLVGRITVRHQPDFEKDGKAVLTTRVTVNLNDGTSLQQLVHAPRGALNRPLSNSEVLAKSNLLLDRLVDSERRDRLVHSVLAMESTEIAKSLLPELRKAVRAPF